MQINNKRHAFKKCNKALTLMLLSSFKPKKQKTESLKTAKEIMDSINAFLLREEDKLK